MIFLNDLARFLDSCLRRELFPGDEAAGVWRPSDRPVARIGLALEPWPRLGAWAARERLDAVFLHRPFRLAADALAPDVGVLAYHLPFDERLTLGLNPRLADALGLTFLEPLGEKDDRPLGMIGDAPAALSFGAWAAVLGDVFGGRDAACGAPGAGNDAPVARVAVVGAMNDVLVREAAGRGARLYVTGQWRERAEAAVRETGIGVFIVGHRRSEEWGLRALAGLLRERWATLDVVTPAWTRPPLPASA